MKKLSQLRSRKRSGPQSRKKPSQLRTTQKLSQPRTTQKPSQLRTTQKLSQLRTTQKLSQLRSSRKPLMPSSHTPSMPRMVRKIVADMYTARVDLALTIMLASLQPGDANTMDVGSFLTAGFGFMLEPIRRGFSSQMCTSLWDLMDYGMQLHTVT